MAYYYYYAIGNILHLCALCILGKREVHIFYIHFPPKGITTKLPGLTLSSK